MPDLGWVGFDPANGICTTDAHARVAIGLDYLGAAPVRGTRYGGGMETLTVAVKVDQAGGRQGQWQSQSQSTLGDLETWRFGDLGLTFWRVHSARSSPLAQISRSLNFWILPDPVSGNVSTTNQCFGVLCGASEARM